MSHFPTAFAAVDLGATSGRVMLGRVDDSHLELTEVHRFPNRPVRVRGTLYWDLLGLYRGVLDGLGAAAAEAGRLDGIGVDSWAVDYALLDGDGALLGNPVHYRDGRTERAVDEVLARMPAMQLYAETGIQLLPFNTVFQLAAAAGDAALRIADRMLLVPDLIGYWLTGVAGTELTNASTTALLDPRTGTWSPRVAEAAGVDLSLFPPLRRPGEPAGTLLPEVAEEIGLTGPVPVYAVASHDTASAVVAVPAETQHFAYISSGTWSLVGLELDRPVLNEDSRRANFTNELGVDNTVRYLRNVMGLWLLQECLSTWREAGAAVELPVLLRDAARTPRLRSVVDATDNLFLAPGDMPARIAAACQRTGQPVPATPAEMTRCVLDSLALAYRDAVADAARLAGRPVEAVHVVGGGARNELLCQLTSDACRLPVIAGPAEATALGNVLVQARAAGAFHGDLARMRMLVRATQPLRRYQPTGTPDGWATAANVLASRAPKRSAETGTPGGNAPAVP